MGKKIYLNEAIKLTGLSEFTLRSLVRQRKVSHFRAGEGKNGKIVFDVDLLEKDLNRLMAENLEPVYREESFRKAR